MDHAEMNACGLYPYPCKAVFYWHLKKNLELYCTKYFKGSNCHGKKLSRDKSRDFRDSFFRERSFLGLSRQLTPATFKFFKETSTQILNVLKIVWVRQVQNTNFKDNF